MNIFIFIIFTVLMPKMAKVGLVHRWKVALPHLAADSSYKIYRKEENLFFIDQIQILKCHRNLCHVIRVSPANGKFSGLEWRVCIFWIIFILMLFFVGFTQKTKILESKWRLNSKWEIRLQSGDKYDLNIK